MKYPVDILIISFFIYNFCGWIWESIILPTSRRQPFVNRGFLEGPWLPIYGTGAILVILLFDTPGITYPIHSLFLLGGLVACTLEYITSYVMEKLFHDRWWDYSDKAFNINGRVCLEGFLCFGLFSVIAIKITEPFIASQLGNLSINFRYILCSILLVLFITDIVYTLQVVTKLRTQMEMLVSRMELDLGKFNTVKEEYKYIREKIKAEKIKYSNRRILKAYPHLVKFINDKKSEE